MSPGYSFRDHIIHRRIIYQSNAIIWSSFCLALLREISISQSEVLSMLLSDSISSFRANFYLVVMCFILPSRSSIYGEHIQFLKHIYSCVGLLNSCDASSSSRYYVSIISVLLLTQFDLFEQFTSLILTWSYLNNSFYHSLNCYFVNSIIVPCRFRITFTLYEVIGIISFTSLSKSRVRSISSSFCFVLHFYFCHMLQYFEPFSKSQ